MTRDDIHAAVFPLCAGGYARHAVDHRLREIADLRDLGFAPRSFRPLEGFGGYRGRFRGYDPDAVDQFFDALAGEAAAAGLREVPDVPADPVLASRAERKQYEADCEARWRGVAELPGTHLCRAERKITGGHGETLLTRRWRELTFATSQVLQIGGRGAKVDVVSGAGDPVLWVRGYHLDRKAAGIVLLPGRRCFVFPVKGTWQLNAVMTGVDESDTEVLWFRKMGLIAHEVVVSPGCDSTTEILCIVELVTPWLSSYFQSESGGG
jgi:hypothetical protein